MINGIIDKTREYNVDELTPGIYIDDKKRYLLVCNYVMLYLNNTGELRVARYIDLIERRFFKVNGKYTHIF